MLAAGAALVQITGHPAPPDISELAQRCAQERVTATVDTPVDGIRTLPDRSACPGSISTTLGYNCRSAD